MSASRMPGHDLRQMMAQAQQQDQQRLMAQQELQMALQAAIQAPVVRHRFETTMIGLTNDPEHEGQKLLMIAIPGGERYDVPVGAQVAAMLRRALAEPEPEQEVSA